MTYAASALLFLLVTLGGLTRAWAAYVYPPLVPPVDQQTTLTLNLERSTLGSTQHYIWNQQRNGWGGDNAPYAQNHWLCYSATDATYGAGGCFESIHSGPLPRAFALTFTEQISRATHTINLNGRDNLIKMIKRAAVTLAMCAFYLRRDYERIRHKGLEVEPQKQRDIVITYHAC